jgi:hypothetical protein
VNCLRITQNETIVSNATHNTYTKCRRVTDMRTPWSIERTVRRGGHVWGGEKCIWDFGGEARRKDTNLKT